MESTKLYRVKPLEFVERHGIWTAMVPGGCYVVAQSGAWSPPHEGWLLCRSRDEAKQLAQQHWESELAKWLEVVG